MKKNQPGLQIKPLYVFILLALIVAVLFVRKTSSQNAINKFKTTVIPNAVKKLLNDPGVKFTIANIKDENGVYEFELNLESGKNAQKYTSFITKNGKIVFTSGVKLAELDKQIQQGQAKGTQASKKLTPNDLVKAETPNLAAFVVSNCPYGLQMQRTYAKAIDEIPSLANNLKIRYIGAVENNKITSMHGDKEAQENLRQICIREEQKEKYWDYVNCYMKEGKSDECTSSSSIDQNQLTSCVNNSNQGLKYAKADFDAANKFGVSSSPTLVLNDKQVVSEFDFGGRTPDTLRQIVCYSNGGQGDYCKTTISKDEVATSFSLTNATTTAGSASSCGQ